MKYVIVKINNQYHVNCVTHKLVYDNCGHYLGQWQDNAFGPGRIFIKGLGIKNLTNDEMSKLEIYL